MEIRPLLEPSWKGWWGKAALFAEANGLQGKVVFIDLDMIITKCIDDLLDRDIPFGILKSDEIDCEQQKDGFNSSIICWNTRHHELFRIYQTLKDNYLDIQKFIFRFDFWLEQMVTRPVFLQTVFSNPHYISDFMFCGLQDTSVFNSLEIHIVCFPRKPKPEDYPAEWVSQYW